MLHIPLVVAVLGSALPVQQTDAGYRTPGVPEKRTENGNQLDLLDDEHALPMTLTIRGGISLGAYEAGYNWALLRMMRRSGTPSMRRPRVKLQALSGASAGNINVFLGAIDWLEQEPTQLDGNDNLLWKAWINVGIQQLLPPVKDCAGYQKTLAVYDPLGNAIADDNAPPVDGCHTYAPNDGLLSRRAFEHIYATIQERLARGGFRDGEPPLPLGVSMTMTQPHTKRFDSLVTDTQRAFTAFSAEVHGGQLDFKSYRMKHEPPSLGRHIFLKPETNGSLNGAITEVATASSAFPVAFGPKPMCVYLSEPGADDATCTNLRFLDGGVFDNAPVRLAQSLAGGKGAILIDLDPDLPADPSIVPPAPRPGLSETLSILGGAVTTARRAEMLNLADSIGGENGRRREADGYRVFPMRRSVRVYGERLSAFAAFIARAYRRYDYYVGVYDAAYAVARDRCYETRPRFWLPEQKSAEAQSPPDADACFFDTVHSLYGELDVGSSPDAAFIFDELVRSDAAGSHVPHAADDGHYLAGEASPVIRAVAKAMLLGPEPGTRGTNLASVALQRDGTLGLLQRLEDDDNFTKARNACRKQDKPECIEVKELDDILQDTNGWVAAEARAALSRMYDVEHGYGGGVGETVADFAQFLFEQDAMPRRTGAQLEWSVPRWSWHRNYLWLLPTVIDLHLKDGGGALRYLPAYAFTSHWVGIVPVTPLWWQRDTQQENSWRVFGTAGLGLQYRTESLGLSAIELAGHVIADTYNRGDRETFAKRLSAELGLYWAAGKVHTALQCGDGPAFQDDGVILGRNCLFKLGLADVPGLVYWAARLGD